MSWRWNFSALPNRIEKLSEVLELEFPGRVVVTSKPGRKRDEINVFLDKRPPARLISLGGKVSSYQLENILKSQSPIRPIRVNKTLWVVSGENNSKILPSGAKTLCVPAGAAFGTGEHATTGMMLRALGRLKLTNRGVVVDVGTGSGILALVARELGFKHVEAIDNDPVAIRVARENERKNFKTSRICWSVGDLTTWRPKQKAELLLANVYGEVLKSFAKEITLMAAPGAKALLSGILTQESDGVKKTWQKLGWKCERQGRRGKWILLELSFNNESTKRRKQRG